MTKAYNTELLTVNLLCWKGIHTQTLPFYVKTLKKGNKFFTL